MASGKVVGIIQAVMAPAANGAAFGVRAGGSTPGENFPIFKFDDTTSEYLDIYFKLENYDAGGLVVAGMWSAADTTVDPDVVKWEGAFRRLQADAEDIDASHTYDYNAATESQEASASGEGVFFSGMTFTHGADMDSIVNGECGVFRLRRNTSTTGNNLGGDAELWISTLTIKES